MLFIVGRRLFLMLLQLVPNPNFLYFANKIYFSKKIGKVNDIFAKFAKSGKIQDFLYEKPLIIMPIFSIMSSILPVQEMK